MTSARRQLIDANAWLTSAKEFRRQYSSGTSGRWDAMCSFKLQQGGKWCRGKTHSEVQHPANILTVQ